MQYLSRKCVPMVLSYFLTIFRNPSPFISTNFTRAVISVYAPKSGVRVFPDGTAHECCRFPLPAWARGVKIRAAAAAGRRWEGRGHIHAPIWMGRLT